MWRLHAPRRVHRPAPLFVPGGHGGRRERTAGNISYSTGERSSVFTIRGDVTCARVSGNRATLAANLDESINSPGQPPQSVIVFLEDNGAAAADRYAAVQVPLGTAPSTCPAAPPPGTTLGPGYPGRSGRPRGHDRGSPARPDLQGPVPKPGMARARVREPGRLRGIRDPHPGARGLHPGAADSHRRQRPPGHCLRTGWRHLVHGGERRQDRPRHHRRAVPGVRAPHGGELPRRDHLRARGRAVVHRVARQPLRTHQHLGCRDRSSPSPPRAASRTSPRGPTARSGPPARCSVSPGRSTA